MEKQLGAEAAGAAGAAATVAPSLENRAASVSTQRVGATVNLVTIVEGEAISPYEHADSTGWMPYYRRVFGRAQQSQRATLPSYQCTTPGYDILIAFHVPPLSATSSATSPDQRSVPKYLPAPLPKEDIKIVIRPRDGLNVASYTWTTLFNALCQAAGLALQETRGDHLSVNKVQNLLVLSSPDLDRAENYARISSITFGSAMFSARGYIACPENTVKGVVHEILPDHTAADIHDAVVLSCNYRSARVACGLANPMDEHQCIIRCALCGLAHPTGDAICQKRYRTPLDLQQQKQRRARSRNHKPKDEDPQRNHDRTDFLPRLPSDSTAPNRKPATPSTVQRRRSRSKSKRSVSQPPPPAKNAPSDQRPSSQVSW
ncbi:hypothetical protein HPB48_009953 [Haemaphysalis longicornis]|uniref:Uncharacterized protein n=1 Tax=Haemaphysalis longicornis TaxID=44386 RepID=A0A9J6GSX9_HAELO|nr:hypothetical protein HPB48_009953 [Haemaphysalis longicornis]